ncbi:MAG: double zinc ribbon domain-containing protein [Candidatus Saccharibacteria bacterium]
MGNQENHNRGQADGSKAGAYTQAITECADIFTPSNDGYIEGFQSGVSNPSQKEESPAEGSSTAPESSHYSEWDGTRRSRSASTVVCLECDEEYDPDDYNECPNCGADLPEAEDEDSGEEGLIECSDCGQIYNPDEFKFCPTCLANNSPDDGEEEKAAAKPEPGEYKPDKTLEEYFASSEAEPLILFGVTMVLFLLFVIVMSLASFF